MIKNSQTSMKYEWKDRHPTLLSSHNIKVIMHIKFVSMVAIYRVLRQTFP